MIFLTPNIVCPIFVEHLELPNRHRPPRISSCLGTLHKLVVTVLVRDNRIHMADMVGVKLAFSVVFLIRKLAFLKVAEEPLVWHDVMREEGAHYGLYLIVRHSILIDIIMENPLFLRPNPFKTKCI